MAIGLPTPHPPTQKYIEKLGFEAPEGVCVSAALEQLKPYLIFTLVYHGN